MKRTTEVAKTCSKLATKSQGKLTEAAILI